MSHKIRFSNTENDWSNGLPLGDGIFGTMAIYNEGVLLFPMNHYEVYYHTSATPLPAQKAAKLVPPTDPGAKRRDARARAIANRAPEGERSFWYYRGKRGAYEGGGGGIISQSHPLTGEIALALPRGVRGQQTDLVLDVEEAAVTFTAKGLSVRTICARNHCLIHEIKQKKPLVKEIYMSCPAVRDAIAPEVSYFAVDDTTFGYTVDLSARCEGNAFKFVCYLRLHGATGKLSGNTILVDAAGDYTVTAGVFTPYSYKDPEGEGLAETRALQLPAMQAAHRAYWDAFFDRAAISLPDKFLEKIWYINQYALDCSSGRDGVMKHQACGLNGLWDVKRPTLWGSRWYWDVNIQAAFAGVFSSNRLELGRAFCDGLKSYVPLAEHFCKTVHGVDGIAIDYPYDFYHSCWPWCAAYVWDYYLYTEDKEFLKNDAYPIFLGLCRCAVNLFEWDEQRGEYIIFPDISPEQGPLGANSVITVASVKYMLGFTLEAAKILGDNDPLLADIERLHSHMPKYPLVKDKYGERLLDSEEAPPDLGIRHPSMLMPVFPTGEIHKGSPRRWQRIASNTVSWLEDHCESGIFHVSWLAAACARMGEGQRALRLLYEKGINLILRTNGLAAEETNRFIHHSLILRQPLYYPCMMEFTGEMLAAVNEMLMQSDNGIIRVFPALPDGDPEINRLWDHGIGLNEYKLQCCKYDAWRDVRFDKLLARGAFEVSAEMREGHIKWITVHSKNGNPVALTSPHRFRHLKVFSEGKEIPATVEQGVLRFATEAGKTYVIAKAEGRSRPVPRMRVTTAF